MIYASFLPSDVKSSFSSLGAAMASIFGDHGYPETYRQELPVHRYVWTGPFDAPPFFLFFRCCSSPPFFSIDFFFIKATFCNFL
jgi:hypothetical protein